jgi:hypothetical protein
MLSRAVYILANRPQQFWLCRAFKVMFNGLIESFNGQLCDEFVNIHKFVTLHHVRKKLRAWQDGYDHPCLQTHSAT